MKGNQNDIFMDLKWRSQHLHPMTEQMQHDIITSAKNKFNLSNDEIFDKAVSQWLKYHETH